MTAPAAAVLRPAGDLCEDTIAPFARYLDAAPDRVVIDLTDVTMLGAAAMREIVRYRQRGGTVSLRHAGPIVVQALTACGFDGLLSQPRP
jgi:anti-anti-sigma regulatory factor